MSVKLWDTGKTPSSRILGGARRQWFTHLAFSHDGKCLAAANADQTVTVWDLLTHREKRTLREDAGPIWGLAFSRDGLIASACGEWSRTVPPGQVKVWDSATGVVVSTILSKVGVVWSVAFSPDGNFIATAGGELNVGPGELKVWDARTGQVVHVLEGHTLGVFSVTFSPDGKLLASAANDGMVKIWDAGSGRERFSLPLHESAVGVAYFSSMSVAFSPDGQTLAVAGDQKVTLWSVATGTKIRDLPGHVGLVRQVVFHPNGERLASAGNDGTVKVWDVRSGQEVLTLHGHRGAVSDVAFSPDGRQLVSASRDGTVRIWDATPWVEPKGAIISQARKPTGSP
jgi:WD40 repeat protein